MDQPISISFCPTFPWNASEELDADGTFTRGSFFPHGHCEWRKALGPWRNFRDKVGPQDVDGIPGYAGRFQIARGERKG